MIIGIEAAHANKPQRTGVENYCWHVIQELKKQIPSTVRVVLYSNKPLEGELGMLPSTWEAKILKWPVRKFWSQIRLSLELLIHPPDIFFAPGQLIPFICPTKVVATVHDCAFLNFRVSKFYFIAKQYLKWMNKMIIKKASLILTPSEFSKKEILKYYKFDPSKIIVTPLGYDPDIYKQIPENGGVLDKYKITKPFIMSVGRLEEKKNTLGIIRAFNELKKEEHNKSLKLVLVGTPRMGYEKIEDEIQESTSKSDIFLPGFIKDNEVAELINSASVFVFPSLHEGFGLPVLEAMACGCPVVAATGNSLEEVGGGAVLYSDPYNANEIAGAVDKLLVNSSLREEKIKVGLERVKNFSWTKTGQMTTSSILSL